MNAAMPITCVDDILNRRKHSRNVGARGCLGCGDSSGVISGLSRGRQNVVEGGPLATVRDILPNNQKKG